MDSLIWKIPEIKKPWMYFRSYIPITSEVIYIYLYVCISAILLSLKTDLTGNTLFLFKGQSRCTCPSWAAVGIQAMVYKNLCIDQEEFASWPCVWPQIIILSYSFGDSGVVLLMQTALQSQISRSIWIVLLWYLRVGNVSERDLKMLSLLILDLISSICNRISE